MIYRYLEESVRAKERHYVRYSHFSIAAAHLVDAIFSNSDLKITTISDLVEQLFGDVCHDIFVRVDEGDDAVDRVAVDGRLEGDAFADLRIWLAYLAERQPLSYHRRHFHETVAGGECEEIGILDHLDRDSFVRQIAQNQREDVVVGAYEIMSVGFQRDMRLVGRLL